MGITSQIGIFFQPFANFRDDPSRNTMSIFPIGPSYSNRICWLPFTPSRLNNSMLAGTGKATKVIQQIRWDFTSACDMWRTQIAGSLSCRYASFGITDGHQVPVEMKNKY